VLASSFVKRWFPLRSTGLSQVEAKKQYLSLATDPFLWVANIGSAIIGPAIIGQTIIPPVG
jgi:hypothetical protein